MRARHWDEALPRDSDCIQPLLIRLLLQQNREYHPTPFLCLLPHQHWTAPQPSQAQSQLLFCCSNWGVEHPAQLGMPPPPGHQCQLLCCCSTSVELLLLQQIVFSTQPNLGCCPNLPAPVSTALLLQHKCQTVAQPSQRQCQLLLTASDASSWLCLCLSIGCVGVTDVTLAAACLITLPCLIILCISWGHHQSEHT